MTILQYEVGMMNWRGRLPWPCHTLYPIYYFRRLPQNQLSAAQGEAAPHHFLTIYKLFLEEIGSAISWDDEV